jgi:hypothetical protein
MKWCPSVTDHRINFANLTNTATPAALINALDGFAPLVRVSPTIPPRARLAVASLISVLARIFPNTTIEGGNVHLLNNPWNVATLDDLLETLRPITPSTSVKSSQQFVIAVGANVSDADLWMGGNDWTAAIGKCPQAVQDGSLGLGLHAAAALAAAEVMKEALQEFEMLHVSMPEELHWNLVDYQLRWQNEPPMTTFQTLRILLAGAGSVGSTVAGLLAMTPIINGEANIVDTDDFDPERNGLRYPMCVGDESGPKVQWLRDLLNRSGWTASAFDIDVAQWCADSGSPGYDGLVISSVDTVKGRLDVADILAPITLSIGVSGLALHLQRETLGDGWACPFCEYTEMDSPMTQVQVLADLTGLPVERVATLQDSGGLLQSEDAALIVAAGRLNIDAAQALIGKRLEDLVQRAYADAMIQTPDSDQVSIAAPYVSLMAGVLGVTELTKAAAGIPMVNRRVSLDLAGIPLGTVGRRPSKINCICNQGVRKRWMRRLYESSENATITISLPQFTMT